MKYTLNNDFIIILINQFIDIENGSLNNQKKTKSFMIKSPSSTFTIICNESCNLSTLENNSSFTLTLENLLVLITSKELGEKNIFPVFPSKEKNTLWLSSLDQNMIKDLQVVYKYLPLITNSDNIDQTYSDLQTTYTFKLLTSLDFNPDDQILTLCFGSIRLYWDRRNNIYINNFTNFFHTNINYLVDDQITIYSDEEKDKIVSTYAKQIGVDKDHSTYNFNPVLFKKLIQNRLKYNRTYEYIEEIITKLKLINEEHPTMTFLVFSAMIPFKTKRPFINFRYNHGNNDVRILRHKMDQYTILVPAHPNRGWFLANVRLLAQMILNVTHTINGREFTYGSPLNTIILNDYYTITKPGYIHPVYQGSLTISSSCFKDTDIQITKECLERLGELYCIDECIYYFYSFTHRITRIEAIPSEHTFIGYSRSIFEYTIHQANNVAITINDDGGKTCLIKAAFSRFNKKIFIGPWHEFPDYHKGRLMDHAYRIKTNVLPLLNIGDSNYDSLGIFYFHQPYHNYHNINLELQYKKTLEHGGQIPSTFFQLAQFVLKTYNNHFNTDLNWSSTAIQCTTCDAIYPMPFELCFPPYLPPCPCHQEHFVTYGLDQPDSRSTTHELLNLRSVPYQHDNIDFKPQVVQTLYHTNVINPPTESPIRGKFLKWELNKNIKFYGKCINCRAYLPDIHNFNWSILPKCPCGLNKPVIDPICHDIKFSIIPIKSILRNSKANDDWLWLTHVDDTYPDYALDLEGNSLDPTNYLPNRPLIPLPSYAYTNSDLHLEKHTHTNFPSSQTKNEYNQILIPDNSGKTLLWKAYPKIFAAPMHELQRDWKNRPHVNYYGTRNNRNNLTITEGRTILETPTGYDGYVIGACFMNFEGKEFHPIDHTQQQTTVLLMGGLQFKNLVHMARYCLKQHNLYNKTKHDISQTAIRCNNCDHVHPIPIELFYFIILSHCANCQVKFKSRELKGSNSDSFFEINYPDNYVIIQYTYPDLEFPDFTKFQNSSNFKCYDKSTNRLYAPSYDDWLVNSHKYNQDCLHIINEQIGKRPDIRVIYHPIPGIKEKRKNFFQFKTTMPHNLCKYSHSPDLKQVIKENFINLTLELVIHTIEKNIIKYPDIKFTRSLSIRKLNCCNRIDKHKDNEIVVGSYKDYDVVIRKDFIHDDDTFSNLLLLAKNHNKEVINETFPFPLVCGQYDSKTIYHFHAHIDANDSILVFGSWLPIGMPLYHYNKALQRNHSKVQPQLTSYDSSEDIEFYTIPWVDHTPCLNFVKTYLTLNNNHQNFIEFILPFINYAHSEKLNIILNNIKRTKITTNSLWINIELPFSELDQEIIKEFTNLTILDLTINQGNSKSPAYFYMPNDKNIHDIVDNAFGDYNQAFQAISSSNMPYKPIPWEVHSGKLAVGVFEEKYTVYLHAIDPENPDPFLYVADNGHRIIHSESNTIFINKIHQVPTDMVSIKNFPIQQNFKYKPPPPSYKIPVYSTLFKTFINSYAGAYRMSESNEYRQPYFSGPHWTNIPKPSRDEFHSLDDLDSEILNYLIDMQKIIDNQLPLSGLIHVTANASQPIKTKFLINFVDRPKRKLQPNSINVVVPSIKGYYREMAFWRLLPLYFSKRNDLMFMIINGRTETNAHFHERKSPVSLRWLKANPDYLVSTNTLTFNPFILNNAIHLGGQQEKNQFKFLHYLKYSHTYGSDELCTFYDSKHLVCTYIDNFTKTSSKVMSMMPLKCPMPEIKIRLYHENSGFYVKGQYLEIDLEPDTYLNQLSSIKDSLGIKHNLINSDYLTVQEEHRDSIITYKRLNPITLNQSLMKQLTESQFPFQHQPIEFIESDTKDNITKLKQKFPIHFKNIQSGMEEAKKSNLLFNINISHNRIKRFLFGFFFFCFIIPIKGSPIPLSSEMTKDLVLYTSSQDDIHLLTDLEQPKYYNSNFDIISELLSRFPIRKIGLVITLELIYELCLRIYENTMKMITLIEPKLNKTYPNLTESKDILPPLKKGTFLITVLGTHGDYIPLLYLARLAAHYGVPTHLHTVKVATNADLDELSKGNLFNLFRHFLRLIEISRFGYVTLQPHNNLQSNGISYQLASSNEYRGPITYRNVKYEPTIYGIFIAIQDTVAFYLAIIFRPTARIGLRNDCLIPRSANGLNMIRAPISTPHTSFIGNYQYHTMFKPTGEPTDKFNEEIKSRNLTQAWCCGSSSENVIPIYIRRKYPRIGPIYDANEFSKYSIIHIHGGAGTFETVLSMGSMPYWWDKGMDRNWHMKALETNSLTNTQLYYYIGFLSEHFKINLPFPTLYYCHLYYLYHNFNFTHVIYKTCQIILGLSILLNKLYYIFVFVIPFPWIIPLIRKRSQIIADILIVFIHYPFLFYTWQHEYIVIFFYLIYNDFFIGTLSDLSAWFNNKTYLKIIRTRSYLPIAYGHYQIHDENGKIVEGTFIDKSGFKELFSLRHTNNPTNIPMKGNYIAPLLWLFSYTIIIFWVWLINLFSPFCAIIFLIYSHCIYAFLTFYTIIGDGFIQIPISYNINNIKSSVAAYSWLHNCQTLIISNVHYSLITFPVLIYIFSFSAIALWVGDWLTHLSSLFDVNMLAFAAPAILKEEDLNNLEDTKNKIKSIENIINQFDTMLPQQSSSFIHPISNVEITLNKPSKKRKSPEYIDQRNNDILHDLIQHLNSLKNQLTKFTKKFGKFNIGDEYEGISELFTTVTANEILHDVNLLTNIHLELKSYGVPDELLPQTIEEYKSKLEEHKNHQHTLSDILAQLATLKYLAEQDGKDKQEINMICGLTLRKFIQNIDYPEDIANLIKELPDLDTYRSRTHGWKYHVLNQINNILHGNKIDINTIPYLKNLLIFVKQHIQKLIHYLHAIFHIFIIITQFIFQLLNTYIKEIYVVFMIIFDHFFGKRDLKRIKAAWALYGFTRTPLMQLKARLSEEIAFSKYKGRTNFLDDFYDFIETTKEYGEKNNAHRINQLGKEPQTRTIRWNKPMMTKKEADLIGLKDYEYHNNIKYVDQINSIFNYSIDPETNESKIPQGGDGVFFGFKHPERIRQSIERYTEQYDPITPIDHIHSQQIVDALMEMYPDSLANCEIIPPKGLIAYVKKKYSPGSPFIPIFKKRSELFALGWEDALIEEAMDNLLKGVYPNQYYHAFTKSQVVNIEKVAKQNKNLRTVISQNPLTYFMDQSVQFQRNKRLHWKQTGSGMGMTTDNNMGYCFEELNKLRKEQGFTLLEADASEFDSRNKPFVFETLAKVAEAGFKSHSNPNISSVLRSHYDAMQNSYIMGITEPCWDSLSIKVPDHLADSLCKDYPSKFIKYDQIKNTSPLTTGLISNDFKKLNREINFSKKYIFVDSLITGTDKHNLNMLISKPFTRENFNQITSIYHNTINQKLNDDTSYYQDKTFLVSHHALLPDSIKSIKHIQVDHDSKYKTSEQQMNPRLTSYLKLYDSTVGLESLNDLISNGKITKTTPDSISAIINSTLETFITQKQKELGHYQSKIVLANREQLYKDSFLQDIYSPFFCELTLETSPDKITDHQIMYIKSDKKIIEEALRIFENRHILTNVHYKNRGGGTGQSATSWDNTWGYKIAIIAAWCEYHNWEKTPQDFLKENLLFNTGDDSAWAINMHNDKFNTKKFLECCELYGVHLGDFEKRSSITKVNYLGKMVRTPNKEDAKTLQSWRQLMRETSPKSRYFNDNITTPKWLVVQCPEDILMRNTAFRYYQAGDVPPGRDIYQRTTDKAFIGTGYLTAGLQRLAGHMSTCAFQPELYMFFLNQYKNTLNELSVRFHIRGFQSKISKDKYNLPYLDVRYQSLDHQYPGKSKKQKHLFDRFYHQNKAPNYIQIIKTHLRPEMDKTKKNQLTMDKILKYAQEPDYTFRISLDLAKTYIADLPYMLTHMKPNLLPIYPDVAFYTYHQYTERFIWKIHIQTGKIDSLESFQSLINQSPFSACCDAPAFYQQMQDQNYETEVLSYPHWVDGNIVICQTIFYTMLWPLERFIIKLYIIGVLFRFFMFTRIDAPKFYSLLNLIFWHSEAESSPEISAMMPKDPYALAKQFVVTIIDFLPIHIFYILPFYHICSLLPPIVELVGRFFATLMNYYHTRDNKGSNASFINPWDAYVKSETSDFKKLFKEQKEYDYLMITNNLKLNEFLSKELNRKQEIDLETIFNLNTILRLSFPNYAKFHFKKGQEILTNKVTQFKNSTHQGPSSSITINSTTLDSYLSTFIPEILANISNLEDSEKSEIEILISNLTNLYDTKQHFNDVQFNQKGIYVHTRTVSRKKFMTINAKTGTGKSTLLPYSILNHQSSLETRIEKVWIVVPRIVLRDEWDSPLNSQFSPYKIQKIKGTDILKPNTKIIICTYGHFYNRIRSKKDIHPQDLIIFDEFHEETGEMIASIHYLLKGENSVLLLSATVRQYSFLDPLVNWFQHNSPIPQRFTKDIYLRDDTIINNFQYALRIYPDQAKKAIIRVNTYEEIDELKDALSGAPFNLVATEVSRRTRGRKIDPESPVLICTQIIDAGINLPNRHLLISNGLMIKNVKGEIFQEETDENTEKQIMGRIGRYEPVAKGKPDIYIRPTRAGSGSTPKPYPRVDLLTLKLVATHFSINQLQSHKRHPDFQISNTTPFLHFDSKVPQQYYNYVEAMALLLFQYTRINDLKNSWNALFQGREEEYDHIRIIIKGMPKLPFEFIYQYILNENIHMDLPNCENLQYIEGTTLTKSLSLPKKDYWLPYTIYHEVTYNKSKIESTSNLDEFNQHLENDYQNTFNIAQEEIAKIIHNQNIKPTLKKILVSKIKIKVNELISGYSALRNQKLKRKTILDPKNITSTLMNIPNNEHYITIEEADQCSICQSAENHTHGLNEKVLWQNTKLAHLWHFFKEE